MLSRTTAVDKTVKIPQEFWSQKSTILRSATLNFFLANLSGVQLVRPHTHTHTYCCVIHKTDGKPIKFKYDFGFSRAADCDAVQSFREIWKSKRSLARIFAFRCVTLYEEKVAVTSRCFNQVRKHEYSAFPERRVNYATGQIIYIT